MSRKFLIVLRKDNMVEKREKREIHCHTTQKSFRQINLE